MKASKKNISPETQQEALSMAKSTQKPGQTKEQTKLIAQGIEKGIALYKKQHKEKLREADKLRKKQSRKSTTEQIDTTAEISTNHEQQSHSSRLPWSLFILSWLGFGVYFWLKK